MSPAHSLTPCSKWLMPPLGMGMLWATFWGASSTWGRIRPPVHLSFLCQLLGCFEAVVCSMSMGLSRSLPAQGGQTGWFSGHQLLRCQP